VAGCGRSPGERAPHGSSGSAGSAARGSDRPAKPASYLLVTIDTWRWDHIGVSRSGKVATPNLDALAREGAYEPELETPVPLTTPAHATLLTALLPLRHRVLDCVGYRLPDKIPTLAEAFREAGFSTAAFVSSATLARRFGLDRGFDVYDDSGLAGSGADYWEPPTRDGARITEAVLNHLRSRPSGSREFLWAHYFDLHLPYRPRPEYDPRYPGHPYAAQAAFVDGQIGALRRALDTDAGRSWRVVVVGDHGEGLGDHGEEGHGLSLYRSTLHVPLLLFPAPERPLLHGKPWRLEDLAPTLREWAGLSKADGADGESLFSKGTVDRILPVLSIQPSLTYGVYPSLGLRRGNLVYLRSGVEELYDLATDPNEERNLVGEPGRRSDLDSLRSSCSKAFPPRGLREAARPTLATSEADLKGLRSLGYLGGGGGDLGALQRVDIRKVCEDDARLTRAREAHRRDGRPEPLIEVYRTLLASYPRAATLASNLGIVLMRANRMEDAYAAFDAAVRINPRDAGSLVNLGGICLMRREIPRARELLEAAALLEPSNATAHKNLGILYSEFLDEPAKAVAHYRKYLDAGETADAGEIRAYLATQAAAGIR
jgi:arylsulfatase A-like enzyme